jgi:hypothetical protein
MAGGDVEAIPPFAGTQYLSMLGRDAAAVLVAHEADHGIALLNVVAELFDQGGPALTKVFLIADFKSFPTQASSDFPAAAFQLVADA